MNYDVIVAGLGAMGSATAFHLASRGRRVLGLDRFVPPHALGSSHGRSRIIREAYFEHPLYVPMVQRAYLNWAELERLSGRRLLVRTGGLMIGPPDGLVAGGARRSAIEHDLAYEELSSREVRRRFPGYRPSDDMVGIWEPRAGFLIPEAAIETHLALARERGAEVRVDEPVVAWRAMGDDVEVVTPCGTYTAGCLVLAVGAWMKQLVPELELPLVVERNVMHWFRPENSNDLFAPERFPVFLCEFAPGRAWYGIPDSGDGIKVALHHQGELTDADALRRDVAPEEIARIRSLMEVFMPLVADAECVESAACMYTNTPDEHFVIDRHPGCPSVIIASPCSGHGFKFSSAIGEILADLATTGKSRFDLSPFRLDRFSRTSQ
ncbi:MAG TPA: N-methyl-L-tryptophan oxidase [Gemmatimonadaceae bacterium]